MDGEIQWTDDSIRWDGGLRVKTNDERLDEAYLSDEEDYVVDPFKDADPFTLFSFHFEKTKMMLPQPPVVIDDATGNNVVVEDDERFVNIQIRGYKTDADEVWQSTGLTLWRASANYLAQYQMENLHLFHNKRILELGAGLGLNGILAWRSTASSSDTHVCITDGDSDALVHLRENVKRNVKVDDGNEIINKVSCHQLIWGQESSETFLAQVANKLKFDVIIASDIIYSAVIIEPLWDTIKILLKEGGEFIMAYARREVPVSIEMVLKVAIQRGFLYELVKKNDEEGIWVYAFRFFTGTPVETETLVAGHKLRCEVPPK